MLCLRVIDGPARVSASLSLLPLRWAAGRQNARSKRVFPDNFLPPTALFRGHLQSDLLIVLSRNLLKMNGICFCNEAPIATNDEECPNFILVHSGGYEFIYAGDGNPMNCCCIQSSATQRCNEIPALASRERVVPRSVDGPGPQGRDVHRALRRHPRGWSALAPDLAAGHARRAERVPARDDARDGERSRASTMQRVRHAKPPLAQVHFGPTGAVTVIGMPMDPHFQSAYYPAEGGNVFGVVGRRGLRGALPEAQGGIGSLRQSFTRQRYN